jgi:peptide/nickel transport system substrate-binding protein
MHKVLRSLFLLTTLIACGGMVWATGSAETPAAATRAQPMTRAARGTQYGEAPELTARVRAGELPPVEQRLPENPLVTQVEERIGQYGGVWRTAVIGGGDNSWINRVMGFDKLVRYAPNSTDIVPDIAERFEASDDATTYTFYLRRGFKWSDGHPYTADDIVFWWEDIQTNPDYQSQFAIRSMYLVDGEPMTVRKIDDYTVQFVFSAPNALFLQQFADRNGFEPTRYPKHYLSRFHPAYNDNIADVLREYGQSDWVSLMNFIATREPAGTGDPSLPVTTAWDSITRYGEAAQIILVRNPYYHRVDPEGNQLPYIDRVVFDQLEDREVLVLKALNGEIDFMDRHIATPANRAVFADNMERGGYEFVETLPSGMNQMIISLNLNHQDPVFRQVFQNRDFRVGLSHAINRQELIDLVYIGQGEPWQAAPRRESAFFDEEMAKQYTEFDVQLANQYLDRAGLTNRDNQRFRLLPDGRRLSFAVEVAGGQQDRIDMLELISGYWREVGVDMQVRVQDRSLLYTRKDAAQHDAVVWGGDGGVDPMTEPRYFFPFSNESNYAPAWAAWYTQLDAAFGGAVSAQEPPPVTRRQMELYDQIKQTGNARRQNELMREIIQIAKEQFYTIGTVLPSNGYGIKKTNFRNVAMQGLHFAQYPAHLITSQFFIEQR